VENVIKVQSFRDGGLMVNGEPVTLDVMRAILAAASESESFIWYFRENPDFEPTPEQFEAFNAIVDSRLPVSLSTFPDFSDAVGPGGVPRPRGD
jgi:hypothetical protein